MFQGSLADAIIMIDGREKPNRQMPVIANRNRQVYEVYFGSTKGKAQSIFFSQKIIALVV